MTFDDVGLFCHVVTVNTDTSRMVLLQYERTGICQFESEILRVLHYCIYILHFYASLKDLMNSRKKHTLVKNNSKDNLRTLGFKG